MSFLQKLEFDFWSMDLQWYKTKPRTIKKVSAHLDLTLLKRLTKLKKNGTGVISQASVATYTEWVHYDDPQKIGLQTFTPGPYRYINRVSSEILVDGKSALYLYRSLPSCSTFFSIDWSHNVCICNRLTHRLKYLHYWPPKKSPPKSHLYRFLTSFKLIRRRNKPSWPVFEPVAAIATLAFKKNLNLL